MWEAVTHGDNAIVVFARTMGHSVSCDLLCQYESCLLQVSERLCITTSTFPSYKEDLFVQCSPTVNRLLYRENFPFSANPVLAILIRNNARSSSIQKSHRPQPYQNHTFRNLNQLCQNTTPSTSPPAPTDTPGQISATHPAPTTSSSPAAKSSNYSPSVS